MAATADRSDAMEKAARFVQRGELDRALKAYVRLFEQDRRDWSVGNTLGDLYVRVGQSKEAIAHFTSLAEQLAKDGFEAKARALYRKILRIQPDNAMARQRVDELDRQQGGSVSPFLKRVLETARASRETAEAEEQAPPLPEPQITSPVPPAPMAQPLHAQEPPSVPIAQPLEVPEPLPLASVPQPLEVPEPLPLASVPQSLEVPEPPPLASVPQSHQVPEPLPPAPAEQSLHVPEPPPPLPEPEPEPAFQEQLLAIPSSAETISPTTAPDPPTPDRPVVSLPSTSAEWEDEWAAVVPSSQEEHEHEIVLTDSILNIGPTSEVDAFRQMQAAADEAVAHGDYRTAFNTVENFLSERPDHILALEKLVEIGVDAAFDVELQSAQLRLVRACVGTERFRQAWESAADLVIRHPKDARYRELLEHVGSVAKAHGFTFPGAPEFDEDIPHASSTAPQSAPAAPALHLVPPPQLEPVVEQPIVVAAAPAQPMSAPPPAQPISTPPAVEPISTPPSAQPISTPLAVEPISTRVAEPAPRAVETPHIDAPAFSDELLREWSDVELTFDTIRNALLDEAAAGAEERLAEAERFIKDREIEGAIRALEEAMCAPHLRVTAGAKLAQLYRENDAPMDALACLEWVAEMPPATEEAGHELAYELAVTLEALGQEAQALGVYRELLAEVGPGYRDIASRAEKLAAA